jgi:hypothetical protein
MIFPAYEVLIDFTTAVSPSSLIDDLVNNVAFYFSCLAFGFYRFRVLWAISLIGVVVVRERF